MKPLALPAFVLAALAAPAAAQFDAHDWSVHAAFPPGSFTAVQGDTLLIHVNSVCGISCPRRR